MLKLMYITNQPEIAAIAEEYSVDRIFVDLETLGKEERQAGMNTVKSRHSREDVSAIRQVIRKARTSVVLCDTAKFSRLMPYTFADFCDVDYLISDGEVPPGISEKIKVL